MSFLFPKQPKQPALPPPPPVPPPPAVKPPSTDVEDDVRADLRRRKGRSSTIATSGVGLTTEAETRSPSLLGSAGGSK
jgi:type IV secretory pathway VirB10-like protein